MYNVRDMSWMLESMSIHQKDSKGMVKSNFVTSCFAFRSSIPIEVHYYKIIYGVTFKIMTPHGLKFIKATHHIKNLQLG